MNSATMVAFVPEYDYVVVWIPAPRTHQSLPHCIGIGSHKKRNGKTLRAPPPTPNANATPPTTLVNLIYIYINQGPKKSNVPIGI